MKLAWALLVGCGPVHAGQDGPPPIVVVSLDTVRADRLGAYGNPRGLTPNLDAFAAESVVFSDTLTTSNITAMAHASLFTSRYPSEVGESGTSFSLGAAAPTLADVLAAYGYQTAAFTSGGHLDANFGLARGFATFEASAELGSLWHTVPRALRWLDTRDSDAPPLLFVHGYDAHAPYLEPAPFGLAWAHPGAAPAGDAALRSLIGTELVFDRWLFRDPSLLARIHDPRRVRAWDPEIRRELDGRGAQDGALSFGTPDAERVRDAYDGAVAYADAMVGLLMAGLHERGLDRRAIVVVLADHGESLGEDGRFGHGDALGDAELRVPLMIRAPGAAPRRVEAPVSLLDVTPTLLELAGAQPLAEAHGSSLRGWLLGGEGPSHPVRHAEGSTRALSTATRSSRLTLLGLSPNSPWLVALAEAAPPGLPAWEGDEGLRDALLDWRRDLVVSAGGETADAAAVEGMKARGYW